MNTNVVRTLTIRGKTEGVAQVTSEMKGLEKAVDGVTKSAVANTTTTETQAKRQLSLADAVEKSERRFNSALRAQQDFEKVQRQMNAAVAQNPALQERANAVLALAKQHFDQAGKGAQMHGAAMQAAAAQASALASRLGPLGGVLSALGPAGVVAAAGIAVVGAASVKAVESFRKLEEHQLTLNSMLQSTGMAAGRTADDIEKMATEIGNISEVRKAAIELVKFGNISKDIFDRTLVAADDLSAAGFGSISSAAEALGKALESPADGLTRLRRAGIIFSDSQIAMVKNMQETGRLAEAQRFILDELAKKVGGAGAARDQGLAGSYEALGDATQRLLEKWGRQIVEGTRLTAIIKGLADATDKSSKNAANQNSPSYKLATVDESIGIAQSQIAEAANPRARMAAETALNNALALRAKLLPQVADETWKLVAAEAKAASARVDASKSADTAADLRRIELIKGVVKALDEETESLKKNAFERAVDKAMRQAEVAPGSAGEGPIRQAVNTRMATEAVEQYVEATKLQTANQIVQARSMTMSAAEAARYKSEQEMVNKLTADGSTLTAAQRLQIAAIAKDFGKSAGAIENANVALANRGRLLSGRQGIETAQLELSMIGKTAQEQERLTGQLRIKHQLEQDAAQRNATVDPAHLKTLQDQAAELAKINAQTRAVNQVKDVLEGAASGFVSDLTKGVSLMDALANAAGRLGQQLIDIGTKQILGQLMSAATAGGGSMAQGPMQGGAAPLGSAATGAGMGSMLSSMGAAAGPIALVAGIGLSMFQANQQAKKAEEERIEKAKKVWEDSKSAAETWMTVMKGGSVGTLKPSIEQQLSQYKQFANLAHEAGDNASVRQMQDSFNEFIVRTLSEFRDQWFITVAGLEQGIGPDSPLQKGASEMQALGLDMLGMIEDAREAFGGFEPVIERTRQAAISYMLAQLGTVKPLSDVQEQLLTLQGRASTMQAALVKLGETAESAAAKISEGLTAAIAQMAVDLRTQIERDINEATGGGWLNSIIDLGTEFQQVSADAKALGLDAGLVSLWLQSMAQEIVNSEQLVGAQFDAVLRNFPELAGQIHEFVDVLVRSAADIAAAQQGYQDQLFTLLQDQDTLEGQLAVFDLRAQREREAEVLAGGQAMADLEALQMAQRFNIMQDWNDRMLEEQQQAADEALSFWNGFAKQISDYTSNFYATPQGGLSPQAQLDAALSQFTSQLSLAQGGDRDALSGITGVHSTLVDAVRGFYASSTPGQSIIDSSLAQVGALPDQVRPEDLIIAAIEDTTDAIDGINSAIVAAVAANSPTQFALAIAGNFDTLDTSLDGLINLEEMKTALGSSFTGTGTFKSIFDKIAGTDGLISKTEAIKGSTATTVTNTGTAATNTGTTATNTGTTATNVGTVSGAVDDLSVVVDRLSDANYPVVGNLDAINKKLSLGTKSVADYLDLIRDNVRLQNAWWGYGGSVGVSPNGREITGFHTGGLVGANDNEVYAKLLRNEYVLQPSAVASIGVPALNYANTTGRLPSFGGSDNSAVISELRGIAARLERVERAANRTAGNVQAGAAEVVAGTRAVMAPLTRKARLDAARVAA